MVSEPIRGTLAAAVTPLRNRGGCLDEDAFAPLLDYYAAGGAAGVLLLGTTGEGILLGCNERRRAAELAVAGAGGLRVIVHCGAQTTAETCALAAHAAEAGASAVAVIGPPYFPFSDRELVVHFARAAEACAPLPFYLYEYAQRTGYTVPVPVVEAVRERASNLVGMKVSDAPFDQVAPYLGTGLDIFIGAEQCIPEGLERGAVGAVSGVAAAFPRAVCQLVEAPSADQAQLVSALRAALSVDPFQASVKTALRWRGVPISLDVRAPLQPLAPDAVRRLHGELEALVGSDMAM